MCPGIAPASALLLSTSTPLQLYFDYSLLQRRLQAAASASKSLPGRRCSTNCALQVPICPLSATREMKFSALVCAYHHFGRCAASLQLPPDLLLRLRLNFDLLQAEALASTPAPASDAVTQSSLPSPSPQVYYREIMLAVKRPFTHLS